MPEVTYDSPFQPDKLPAFPILQLSSIIANTQFMPAIRGLALHLAQKEYLNVGLFFKTLSDLDVAFLDKAMQKSEDEFVYMRSEGLDINLSAMPYTQQISVLCFLLARAEGYPDLNPEVLAQAVPNLVSLLFIEEMYRAGRIKINRLNYSLFDNKKQIVTDKNLEQMKEMYSQYKKGNEA